MVLINADGGLGYPERQPYDRISVTAACRDVPPPLSEQLAVGGRLIAPLVKEGIQTLVVLEKTPVGLKPVPVCEVLYVNLRGAYGVG